MKQDMRKAWVKTAAGLSVWLNPEFRKLGLIPENQRLKRLRELQAQAQEKAEVLFAP